MSTITERIDKVTKIPANYLHTILPPPKSVKIEITGRCNYRCSFCALAVRSEQPTVDMDLAFFKRITKEMLDSGVEEIGCFFIGESFLNPKLLTAAITYLKSDIGMPFVFLTSNASAATPANIESVMAAGLDSLKWSVNAADDDQFRDILKADPKMRKKALANIKAAYEIRESKGYATRLYASSIQYDGDQQNKMLHALEDVLPYVDQHYWLPLYSMGSFATQREEELGYRPTAGNQGRIGALRDPLPCWTAFTAGHVTVDGKLSACCFDADGTWVMGDLHRQSFMEAWNSETFQTLRAAHLKRDVSGTVCEKCIAYQGATA